MNWRTLIIGKIILLVLFLGAWSWFADAAKVEYVSEAKPEITILSNTPPDLTTKAYVVLDMETGLVVAEKEADTVLPIASVTKLFTALAVLDTLETEKTVTVSPYDVWSPEPFGKLSIGEEYTYRDLVFPLLLESSNDAAALFERVTEGQVIEAMNGVANDAGLAKTKFIDASGLSSANVSTASELATYLRYLNKKQPHILDITRLPQYVGPYTGWVNNSPVFGADYQGGKHGYTVEAGRTLAAIFSLPIGETKRDFIIVVLGSRDIVSESKKLKAFTQENVRFE